MKNFYFLAVLLGFFVSGHLSAVNIIVSSTANSGAGTLRQAITDINLNGAGPHSITFNVTGPIVLAADLPTINVSNVTIDGGAGVTINSNNAHDNVFLINGTASGFTVKNITATNMNYRFLYIAQSVSNVTIENVTAIGNPATRQLNHFINSAGGITINGLTITNSRIENVEWQQSPIQVANVNNLQVDGLVYEKSGGGGSILMFINGSLGGTTNFIKNVDFDGDLDGNASDPNASDDSDRGLHVSGTVQNLSIENCTFNYLETLSIDISGVATNVAIKNSTFSVGGGTSIGIYFHTTTNGITIDGCTIDTTITPAATYTNNGDYGIFFNGAATNIDIKNTTISSAELQNIRFVSTATTVSMDNVSINNLNGWDANCSGCYNYAILFSGAATGVTMNKVTASGAQAGTTTLSGNRGIWFEGSLTNGTFTDVTANLYRDHNFVIIGNATNVILNSPVFDNSGFTTQQGTGAVGFQINGAINGLTIDGNAGTQVGKINMQHGNTALGTDEGNMAIRLYAGGGGTNIRNVSIKDMILKAGEGDGIQVDSGIILDSGVGMLIENNTISVRGGTSDDGMEFYNNLPRSSVVIRGNTIEAASRYGMMLQMESATSEYLVENNTILQSDYEGILFYGGDGNKATVARNNTITNTSTVGGQGAFYVWSADGITLSQNSVYNNKGNMEFNANNTGNLDLQRIDYRVPVLVKSTKTGANAYTLEYTLPSQCSVGCNVEFFYNRASDLPFQGRQYIQTDASKINGTHSITLDTSGLTANNGLNATDGYFTATLTLVTDGSTSEYSYGVPIAMVGPATVDDALLWYRADYGAQITAGTNAADDEPVTLWKSQLSGFDAYAPGANQPVLQKDIQYAINFNPVLRFTSDELRVKYDINPNQINPVTIFTMYKTPNNNVGIWGNDDGANDRYFQNNVLAGNEGAVAYPGSTTIANLSTIQWNNGSTNGSVAYLNGTAGTAFTQNGAQGGYNYFNMGNWGSAGANGDLNLAEMIVYPGVLTQTEREKVETYLAVKYGATLGHNYLSKDGTIIYDVSSFGKNVISLGRDDSSFLHQQIAKSANYAGNALLTLSTDTNFTNVNGLHTAIAADQSFFIIGDNDGSILYQTSYNGTNVNSRMARVWKVQETGTDIGNINISVDDFYAQYILVSTDPTFATGVTEVPLVNKKAAINLANGQFITIATRLTSPGGVNAGLELWLAADDLSSGNIQNGIGWIDRSQFNNTFEFVNSDPAVVNNGINFNKVVKFDGDDFLRDDNGDFITDNTAGSVFSLLKDNAPTGRHGFPYDLGGVDQGHYTYDQNVFDDYGTNDRLGWNPLTGTISDGKPGVSTITNTGIFTGNWNLYSAQSAANNWAAGFNGLTQASTTTNTIAFAGTAEHIGARGGSAWVGEMPEIINYNRILTANEKQKVESYLAIKYGVTLGKPASPIAYLSSSNVEVWTADAAYQNNIVGLGRDDTSSLHQRISKPVLDTTLPITISTNNNFSGENNAVNHTNIAADKQFLIIGDNGLENEYKLYSGTAVNSIMKSIWKLQATGITQFNLKIDDPKATHIILSTDDTFTSADTEIALDDGEVLVNIGSFKYFTFARTSTAPGGVLEGLQLWVRGDKGLDFPYVNAPWVNQSPINDNPLIKGAGNMAILYNQGGYNFNPVLDQANGTNNYLAWTPFKADAMYWVGANQEPTSGDYSHIFWQGTYPTFEGIHGGVNVYQWSGANQNGIQDANTWSKDGLTVPYSTAWTNKFQFVGINLPTSSTGITIGSTGGQAGALTRDMDAHIAEIIAYERDLTALEKQQVESYIAFRNAITYKAGTATNYLASNGTTVFWTGDAAYQFNIFGLGRDDLSSLNQQISRASSDALLTIATDNAFTAPNGSHTAIANDKSFFAVGDNGNANNFVNYNGTGSANARYNRVWKVQETGTDLGSVFLNINDASVTVMLVSTDPTFATAVTEVPIANKTVSFNFVNGQYFSFAKQVISPGGVANNLLRWYRADTGYTVASGTASWQNMLDGSLPATQATAGSQPVYNTTTNLLNFNPTLTFDGGDNLFISDSDLPIGTTARNSFAVASNNDAANNRYIFTYGTQAISQAYGHGKWGVNLAMIGWGNDLGATDNSFEVADGYSISMAGYNGTQELLQTNAGGNILTRTTAINTVRSGSSRIGALQNGAEAWLGNIAEVIFYDRDLSAADRLQVESYMAIKYAITMGSNASPVDYKSSEGTTYWTASATHQNGIMGLAKDAKTGLHQQIAKAHGAGSVLTISTDNNFTNPNGSHTAIPNNLSFFTVGHNGASSDYITYAGGSSASAIMQRVWTVQESGTDIGAINLHIDKRLAQYLVVSSDATFTDADNFIPLSNNTASVDLESGEFFTFATRIIAPGGIVTGMELWLAAEDNATGNLVDGTGWIDRSQFQNTFNFVAGTPETMTNKANFNKAVNFAGGDWLEDNLTNFVNGNTAGEVFSIVKDNAYTGGQLASAFSLSNGQDANNYTWSDQAVYESYGTNDRLGWNPLTGVIPDPKPGVSTINNLGVTVDNWSLYNVHSATNDWAAGFNGLIQASTTTNTTAFNSNQERLGADNNGTWIGDMPEIVAYDRILSATEKQRVQSYLAIKYGVTLGNTSNLINYLASDGTTVFWTGDATYQNNVFGIGKDETSGLHQQISKSINKTGLVTFSTDNNLTNANATHASITADKSFLMAGDDNGAATYTPYAGTKADRILTRKWKVQETGTIGTVYVKSSDAKAQFLIVSNDDTFNDSDTWIELVNGEGSVDFNTGQFFTYASDIVAPGGVDLQLTRWYRADIGYDNSGTASWQNMLEGSSPATQATAGSQPVYNTTTNLLNFNPTLTFDGGDNLSISDSDLPIGAAARNTFAVASNTNAGSTGWIFDYGTQATSQAYFHGKVGTNLYLANWGNDLSATDNSFEVADGYSISMAGYSGTQQLLQTNAGGNILTRTTAINTVRGGTSRIGMHLDGSGGWLGNIAEVIFYDRDLSAAERLQVQSYMAIKYGIMMGSTTNLVNYTNTSNATVWTADATYHNDVFGIAKDRKTGLEQQISTSTTDNRIIVSTDNNFTLPNAQHAGVQNELYYLLMGNNNGSTEFTLHDAGTATNYIYGTKWKVQESGTDQGTVYLKVANPLATHIIVSNNDTFDAADTEIALTNGVAAVDLDNGQFFTLATLRAAPGGVNDGLELWLRATDPAVGNLVTGTGWVDASTAANDFETVTATPVVNSGANGPSFNKYVNFNGSSFLSDDNQTIAGNNTAAEVFNVIKTSAVGINNGNPFQLGGDHSSFYTFSDQAVYNQFANTDRFGFNPNSGIILDTKPGYAPTTTQEKNIRVSNWNIFNAHSAANNWQVGYNNMTLASSTTNTVDFTGAELVGARSGAVWTGDMAELVYYNRVLTADEKLKVNSYLAVKNGITLGSGFDPIQYKTSVGTTFWSANSTFHNGVAGVGRDDNSGLLQKQSKSVNPGTILSIGITDIAADNEANTATVTNDRSFLMWGTNGGSTTFSKNSLNATFPYQMDRLWLVEEYDGLGGNTDVFTNLEVQVTDILNCQGSASDYAMLVDTDGDGNFSNAAVVAPSFLNGSTLVFEGVNLNHNAQFTIATKLRQYEYYLAPPLSAPHATDADGLKQPSIVVTTVEDFAVGEVTFPGSSFQNRPYFIDFDEDFRYKLSSIGEGWQRNRTTADRSTEFEGIKVRSCVPVLFQVMQGDPATLEDGITAKRDFALGKEFYSGSFTLQNDGRDDNFVSVMASQPNTVVTIGAETIELPQEGSTYIRNLGNLPHTGTHITSDKNIVVTTGSSDAWTPQGCGDNGFDQIFPVDKLGRQYVVVRGGTGADNLEKAFVVGTEDNTQVFFDGVLQGSVNKGQFLSITVSGTTGKNHYIEASKNAYVYQQSGNAGCEIGFAFIPPYQFSAPPRLRFSTPAEGGGGGPKLNIITNTEARGTINLQDVTAGYPGTQITIPSFTKVDGFPFLSTATVVLSANSTYYIESKRYFQLGLLFGQGTTGGGYSFIVDANADLQDVDSDGIADINDLDDDNDGVIDANESTNGRNPGGNDDNDLFLNYFDADGCTNYDTATGICKDFDPDSDGIANHIEMDADDDGAIDNVEAQTTAGYVAPSATITASGVPDNYGGNAGLTAIDTDGDAKPDFLDFDSDSDGVSDFIEINDSRNTALATDAPAPADGIADRALQTKTLADGTTVIKSDDDIDGINTVFDSNDTVFKGSYSTVTPPDTDVDAKLDYRDTDDDGDAIETASEDFNFNKIWSDDDLDADLIPSYKDSNELVLPCPDPDNPLCTTDVLVSAKDEALLTLIPQVYLQVDGYTKGLVLTRVASTANVKEPVRGMLVYDTTTNCIKVYKGSANGGWSACLKVNE